MKISIVGCGKMGHEIVEIFLNSNYEIVWIDSDKEKETECNKYITKKIKRIARFNDWSKEDIKKRTDSVKISFNIGDIYDSDFVLETITENLQAKKDLFKSIEKIVDDNCILLSNTSSTPLKLVYEDVVKKERCAGMHFFYPCKIINAVEINCTEKTNDLCVKKIQKLLESIDRKTIVLEERANLIFSKIICVLMSEVYNIYKEKCLDYKQIDEILKENFMMMGIFEILNSTGNKIIRNCLENFASKEDEEFHKDFKEVVNIINKKYNDCSFNEYISSLNDINFKDIDTDCKNYILSRVQSFYLNYITYSVNELGVNKEKIVDIAKDILGITKKPKEILLSIGEENIREILNKNYQKTNCKVYKVQDFDVWKK